MFSASLSNVFFFQYQNFAKNKVCESSDVFDRKPSLKSNEYLKPSSKRSYLMFYQLNESDVQER